MLGFVPNVPSKHKCSVGLTGDCDISAVNVLPDSVVVGSRASATVKDVGSDSIAEHYW